MATIILLTEHLQKDIKMTQTKESTLMIGALAIGGILYLLLGSESEPKKVTL